MKGEGTNAAPQLSIIVPCLNEAAGIGATLERLQPLRTCGAEVIVVDGGSSDASIALAAPLADRILAAPRGRAAQMNAGAAVARGAALLFLHADTQLPEGALEQVMSRLQGPHCWGRFDVRISGRPAMLRVVACMMNWRSRWTGIATGDQALFMNRQAFDAVGGFPGQPLMEDIEMSKRLRTLSRPACISRKVTTSGRRWETHGVWHTIFLMWRLRWAYWRGIPPGQLAEVYR